MATNKNVKEKTSKNSTVNEEDLKKDDEVEQNVQDESETEEVTPEVKVEESHLDYLDLAQRLKAEFDNYKKRTADSNKSSFNDGKSYAIGKILPVIDSFNQAEKTITDTATLVGVNLIYKQFRAVLEDLGVKKIDAVGKPFDPNFHNAVYAVENSSVESNIVLEELQEGFTLDDKVLRHSVVKISK